MNGQVRILARGGGCSSSHIFRCWTVGWWRGRRGWALLYRERERKVESRKKFFM